MFSTVTVTEFRTTVYLAHLTFGALLGFLVHRYGSQLTGLWSPVLDLLRFTRPHRH